MLRIVVSALMLSLTTSDAFALDISKWQSMNIPGGVVEGIAQSPDDHNVLLAAGAYSVYRTSNGGSSWTRVVSGVRSKSAAFAPSNGSRAYAPYDSGFARSDDGGANWTRVYTYPFSTPPSDPSVAQAPEFFVVDPANQNIIYGYGGTYNSRYHSIYRSLDGGATWTTLYTIPTSRQAGFYGIVSPAHGTIAATISSGEKEDGALFVSSNAADAVPTGTENTTFASTAAWRAVTGISSVSGSQTIYAMSNYALFQSLDGGLSWSIAGNSPSSDADKWFLATVANGKVIASNHNHAYTTANNGSSWTSSTIDSTSDSVDAIIYYSPSDAKLYSGDRQGGGVLVADASAMGALSFSPKNTGLNNGSFICAAKGKSNPAISYAFSGSTMYVSTNSGTSWSVRYDNAGKRFGASGGYGGSHFLQDTDGTLYLYMNGGFYSGAAGLSGSWSPIGSISAVGSLKFAFGSSDHNTIYMTSETEGASSAMGLYKTTNKGAAWTQWAFPGKYVSQVVVTTTTTDSDTVYVSVRANRYDDYSAVYVYKTVNASAATPTWTKILEPAPSTDERIVEIALDPDAPASTVYVAGKQNVYKSVDGGTNWTVIYSGGTDICSLLVSHPANGAKAIYVGDNNAVYLSIDDGASWVEIGTGFNGVKALAEGSLYVGTGEGLYKTEISAKEIPVNATTVLVSTGASGGTAMVTIPPGAFGSAVSGMTQMLDISTLSLAGITPSGLGLEVRTSGSSQLLQPATLTFSYTAADIAGLNPNNLAVIALAAGGYELLPSTPTPSQNMVMARTTHFSQFALVQYTGGGGGGGGTVGYPKAYPIPFNPGRHANGMSIVNLAPSTQVKIYTTLGQLVRKIDVPAAGVAVWDGKNDGGKTVASGVYIMLVKDGAAGATQRLKVIVEK